MKHNPDCINRLQAIGISYDGACALRRISMTLHRWHELECGESNSWHCWCVVRGHKTTSANAQGKRVTIFTQDDAGKPFIESHSNHEPMTSHWATPDRERGALKRLKTIMARYPALTSYVQTDPRGAALYILKKSDIPAGAEIDSCYACGVAVYK